MVKKKISRNRQIADPVFVPVFFDLYRKTKIDLLNAQIKSLECIRTINKIRDLQKTKDELKLTLYRTLSDILRINYKIQESLPIISNPNFMKKVEKSVAIAVSFNESTSYISQFNVGIASSSSNELDQELREIQAKLVSLNSTREFH